MTAVHLTKRVGFQGEHGAFSEEAILREFGKDAKPVPYETFAKVFESVSNAETDCAAVPIENSLEGGVNETYDLLLEKDLKVTGEIKLRIRHCLIGRPDSSLEGIRKVYSHPQALGQCRRTLERLGLEPQPFYDTAGSVKFVARSSDNSLAAIASIRAARVYGMRVLKTGVEDSKTNYTRFLILGRKESGRARAKCKTSLIFSTRHKPGALFDALEPFAKQRINLTKIESRPKKQVPWEYYFYLDFDGSVHDKAVGAAIAALRERADFIKVLGSYPKAK
jgi:prephenate dehydratase